MKVIDAHCYVKFRYSLFAGLPPFEFIARDKPAVPASLVTKWISQSLVVARTDMTGARALGFPHATLTHLESVVRCVAIAMQAAVRTRHCLHVVRSLQSSRVLTSSCLYLVLV